MAKTTFLDWQRDSLLLALGQMQGERPLLDSLAFEEFTQSGTDQRRNPEAAMHRAASRLGVKGPVTVLAARELVEMRAIQIPKMEADELPDIIRFQAQRQFSSMTDAWAVDFVLLPLSAEQEMQTALVAAMSPTQLNEIETACHSVGLQVDRVLLRPLEVARWVIRKSTAGSTGCSMVICVSEVIADILLLRNGQAAQVRSTRLPTEPLQRATALQGEIRRSLLAGSSDMLGSKIESVVVIASETIGQPLLESVQKAAQAKVEQLNFEQLIDFGPPSRADRTLCETAGNQLAGLVGALQLNRDPNTIIDFKHPKKRPPKKKNTRALVMSAAAVATVLLLGLGWFYIRVSQLNAEYEQYSADLATRKEVGAAAQDRIAELRALEQFMESSPNWLDELAYLAERMPEAGQLRLSNPSFTAANSEGIISFTVKADEAASIAKFENSLRSPNHVVTGTGTGQLQSPEENYRWSAPAKITVMGRGWKLTSLSPQASGAPAEVSNSDEQSQSEAIVEQKIESQALDEPDDGPQLLPEPTVEPTVEPRDEQTEEQTEGAANDAT